MNNLKRIRERMGYSQTRLAELAKCSQPMVLAIEKGQRKPSRALAKRLSIVLKCKVFRPEEIGVR